MSYCCGIDCDAPMDKNYYQLLIQLSNQINHMNIINIGTQSGYSAYLLAYNNTNYVYSFDVSDNLKSDKIKSRSSINIKFIIDDLSNSDNLTKWCDILLASTLILIDTMTQIGTAQYQLYCFLKDNNYKGMLICANVWSLQDMRNNFWYKIPPQFKTDLTSIGSQCGTGMIHFDHTPIPTGIPIIDQIPKFNNDNWTLVTAYFDLTHYSDAPPAMRSTQYYLDHAHSVLSLPYNLIVYCDQTNKHLLEQIRPPFLQSKTRYCVLDFDKLQFTDHDKQVGDFTTYRQRIIDNRRDKPYHFDERNTASYYLFCIARNLLLKKTIADNPFKSTHFAWINICIERMGYLNLVHLDQALSIHRNKFSTLYIDYIPRSLVNNTQEYFKYGRCSMCSGFYTGNAYYMYRVCHEMENQFLIYLDGGYGHADEQLMSPVYFKYPELFQHYYGDYQQMITNYLHVYDNPNSILTIFIPRSYQHQFYQGCHDACRFVWQSLLNKTCTLTSAQIDTLLYYKGRSKLSNIDTGTGSGAGTYNQSTIITLLYNVGNPNRVEQILKKSNQWLKLSFPIVIWTDDVYYQRLVTFFNGKTKVKIYNKNIKDFPPFKFKDQLHTVYHDYQVKNRDPVKDSIIYHLLMYSRPYMWAQTINDNPFNTQTFICMDFGLSRFTNDLTVVEKWTVQPQIKMLMINPYLSTDPDPLTYFHHTYHNVAGGLLTGSGTNIVDYTQLFEQELMSMFNGHYCQLDEALTASIVRKYPNLAQFYYGDYCSIITNYQSTVDLTNIIPIIQKYLNNNLYQDAQKVIDSIQYWSSDSAMHLYLSSSILANYYSLSGHLDPKVKHILSDIKYRQFVTEHRNNLKFYGIHYDQQNCQFCESSQSDTDKTGQSTVSTHFL